MFAQRRQHHDTRSDFQQDLGLLPLEVAHTSFLLERLGQDCEPLQYLRELTQNSLEAIARSKQPGDILWQATARQLRIRQVRPEALDHRHWRRHDRRRAGKPYQQALVVRLPADPCRQLRRRCQDFHGSEQPSRRAISLLETRPADTKSCSAAMQTGRYGLRQYALGDDQYSYSPAVPEDSKPAMIETHGTEVTLMGQSEEANTAMPAGVTSPAWISKYLNSRYYRFPQAVSVRVDEASLAGHSDPAGIRTLTGQKAYLDEHAEASGTNGAVEYLTCWHSTGRDAARAEPLFQSANAANRDRRRGALVGDNSCVRRGVAKAAHRVSDSSVPRPE